MKYNYVIGMSEQDIDVKYGMYDLREEREIARSSLGYILSDITDIKRSYFKLGFHLNEFKNMKYYEDFGYLTFDEFCTANFDMDKSAVSRCINVFLMTTSFNEVKFQNGIKSVGCANVMSDKYKDYSYSQLCEMISLSDEQRKSITPEMTIKEIREIKKEKVATSQPEIIKNFTFDLQVAIKKILSKMGCKCISFCCGKIYFTSSDDRKYTLELKERK